MLVFFLGSANHPCLSSRGNCAQICIPHGRNGRKCGCSVGYKKDGETGCTPYSSYALVSQLKMARGFDLEQGAEAMVPIAGKGMYERKSMFIFSSVFIGC